VTTPSGARRAPRERVDGVLLLDKPSGVSSNAALQRARRAFNAEKAGHTGTLDPLASGLLPICFGEATKFARFLLDADKRYRATLRFGVTTTTYDAEGDVVATRPVDVERAPLAAVLAHYTGDIRQVPPAFAALKYQGHAYYDYARKGIDIPREARAVRVHRLALLDWQSPDAVVDVVCSKGTYVRSLAADIGDALGCGAHLAALRRDATGGFVLDDAVALDVLEALDRDARRRLLLPVDALLRELPRVDVVGATATDLRHGRPSPGAATQTGLASAYDERGSLLGVVRCEAGVFVPERMASPSD